MRFQVKPFISQTAIEQIKEKFRNRAQLLFIITQIKYTIKYRANPQHSNLCTSYLLLLLYGENRSTVYQKYTVYVSKFRLEAYYSSNSVTDRTKLCYQAN